MLLQILEDGRLTDSQGRTVDFKNTIIIMTSNVGARRISEKQTSLGFGDNADSAENVNVRDLVMSELKQVFRPEFLNRVDDIIVFNKLTKDEILPGVVEFLTHAREQGYKLALGSASKNAPLILDKLEITPLFDVLIDGTKVSKPKPDPEVFTRGADEMGFSYDECIVFEDALAGIEAAHNGGMKAVGIGLPENLPGAEIHIPGLFAMPIEEIVAKIG